MIDILYARRACCLQKTKENFKTMFKIEDKLTTTKKTWEKRNKDIKIVCSQNTDSRLSNKNAFRKLGVI